MSKSAERKVRPPVKKIDDVPEDLPVEKKGPERKARPSKKIDDFDEDAPKKKYVKTAVVDAITEQLRELIRGKDDEDSIRLRLSVEEAQIIVKVLEKHVAGRKNRCDVYKRKEKPVRKPFRVTLTEE